MLLPVVSPVQWVVDYLQSQGAFYDAAGVGIPLVLPYPLGDVPAQRMPIILVTPVQVVTQPFGVPDLFEERFVFRLFGYIQDPTPESAVKRTWVFGATTMRVLARIPHYLTERGATFYTTEHWAPAVEYGQLMIGQTPVYGWTAELVFQHIARYSALGAGDALAYPPED